MLISNCEIFQSQLLNFLKESAVMVQIWGKQKPPKEKKSVNTKMAILADAKAKGGVAAANDNLKVCNLLMFFGVLYVCFICL